MFDDSLVKLMEDIWGYRLENVYKGQVLPERMLDWFDPSSSTYLRVISRSQLIESIKDML